MYDVFRLLCGELFIMWRQIWKIWQKRRESRYVYHNSNYAFDSSVESGAQGVMNIEPICAWKTDLSRPDSYEWPSEKSDRELEFYLSWYQALLHILSAENCGPIDHLNEVTHSVHTSEATLPSRNGKTSPTRGPCLTSIPPNCHQLARSSSTFIALLIMGPCSCGCNL